MIGRLLRRVAATFRAVPPSREDASARREVIDAMIDESLKRRAADRATRQAAARERENRRHHENFLRDRLIQASRTSHLKGRTQ